MTILNRVQSAGLRTLASSILPRTRKKTNTAIGPEVRPADPGVYVEMAYPPPGGTMVTPILGGGGIVAYRRVNVRPSRITDESDMWAHADGWLPGEFECVVSIERPDGTTFRTRGVVELVVELKASCPAAYTSVRLAMATEAMDQTGREILN